MDILERDIEKRLNKKIKNLGGVSLKFVSPGATGVPDRIVIIAGKLYFVELKRPGEKPRPLQRKVFKDFGKRGFPVYVLSNYTEVDAFVEGVVSGDIQGA